MPSQPVNPDQPPQPQPPSTPQPLPPGHSVYTEGASVIISLRLDSPVLIPPAHPDPVRRRDHLVRQLPLRPPGFRCSFHGGWLNEGEDEACAVPARMPGSAWYLARVAWSWSPWNDRTEAYFLSRGRTRWFLWRKSFAEYDSQRGDVPDVLASVPKRGVPEEVAAIYLLIDMWEQDRGLDGPPEDMLPGLLSEQELLLMAREAWPRK